MKTLTGPMTTFLADPINVESVIIISIDWAGDGQTLLYADKDIDNVNGVTLVNGRILVLGNLDSLLSNKTGSNFSINVTLDDCDGIIKAFLDQYDPYGKPCSVFQYFDDETLGLADKILLAKCKINFDVAWSEGERTVTLTLLSEVEEREVGFSPEEGQFDFISAKAVGNAWPLCFGSPLHVPATLIQSFNTATLNDAFCVIDPLLLHKRDVIYSAIIQNYALYFYYTEHAVKLKQVQDYSANGLLFALLDLLASRQDAIEDYNAKLIEVSHWEGLVWALERGKPNQVAAPGADLLNARANLKVVRAEKKQMEIDTIEAIQEEIEHLEELIPLLEASIEQRSVALDKQFESISAMSTLFQEYITLEIEICTQVRCETTEIHVKDGDNFPQTEDGDPDTLVDVLINNLRFRGTFNNDLFTIKTMLPKYQNIWLSPRGDQPDECSPDEHYATFWVPDETYQLNGLYIYVYSRKTEHNHIVKVIEQEGRVCKIELASHSLKTQSDEVNERVNKSAPFVAVGTENEDDSLFGDYYRFGINRNHASGSLFSPNFMNSMINSDFQSGLINAGAYGYLRGFPLDVQDYIDNNIGFENLNKQQWELILRLSNIRNKDENLYVALINDPFSVPKAFTITTYDFDRIIEASPMILSHWLGEDILTDELPSSNSWVADQGAVIVDADSSCQTYVANIISTEEIKSVSAFRTVKGHRSLVTLPSRYYTTQDETNLYPLTITTIRTKLPLSALDEGWEDDIFVSLTSTVGPNVADVIQYLVETYTDKEVDPASFAAVNTATDAYPVHFALLDKKNVFQQINEIALQARCVVYIINDIYYIKYLSTTPTPVKTLTEADVHQGTLNVTYSDLTNITTRSCGLWNKDYAGEDEPNKVCLRHNIQKYGLHEQEQLYYIYNMEHLVEKSATFWLIRNCNSWKQIQFDTNLGNLDLETFDAVTVDLPHISTEPVVGILESSTYDSSKNTITLSIWLPILSGTMDEYLFAWPGSADSDDEFPLTTESFGSGNFDVTGTLPSC